MFRTSYRSAVVSVPDSPSWPFVISPDQAVFSGRRWDFGRLLMRGALLEFFTVGFYRFWLATDMRRHLWSHTSVGGDTIEYVGTAKELLLGFLFATAILVPIYVAYFVLGIEIERFKAFASVPFALFYYLFAQFAVYRARRYRITRTIWRGVRFGMTGSGWDYAWRAGVWTFVTVLTFGLALPWRQAALERFKMRHTFYGALPGRFEGTGWDFYKRGWWLWLIAALAVATAVVALMLFGSKTQPWSLRSLPVLLPFLLWPFFLAIYRAIEWRWWVSGIRFGDVRFQSQMTSRTLLGPYLKVIAWSVLLLALLFGLLVGLILLGWYLTDPGMRDVGHGRAALRLPWVLAALGVGTVIALLAFVVAVRLYLIHDVWLRVVGTTRIYYLETADSIVAQGEAAGAIGEGFADSLDIAGF